MITTNSSNPWNGVGTAMTKSGGTVVPDGVIAAI
jgi:hypothetical protein